MADNDDDMVPERDWWKRAYPVSNIPEEIRSEYLQIKKLYGSSIAAIVYRMYWRWGPRAAKELARRILSFESADKVYEYLLEKIRLFDDKSRKLLASTVFLMKYEDDFERVKELSEAVERKLDGCRGLRDAALKVLHELAMRSIFYSPRCIVEYALMQLNCAAKPTKMCRETVEQIDNVLRNTPRGGGGTA